MLEVTVPCALIVLYLVFSRGKIYDVNVIWASVFMAAYLLMYLYMPPTSVYLSSHAAGLFGVMPAVSYGAILFADLNPRLLPEVTRALGWVGLLVVFSILSVFKFFVW